MRRELVIMLAAIVLTFAIVSPQADAQQSIAPERSDYSYPDSWRVNFMTGCTSGGGATDMCVCVLRGFEFSWPFWVAEEFDVLSQLPEAGRSTRQHELNAAATRIILACANNANTYP